MNHRQAVVRTDYDEFSKWWEAHGWTPVPKQLLPPTGFVVYDGSGMKAAGWLLIDANVPLGVMEWIVTNPNNSPKESLLAIHIVVQQIQELADTIGIQSVFTTVKNGALARVYEKDGFIVTDKNATCLVWSKSWSKAKKGTRSAKQFCIHK